MSGRPVILFICWGNICRSPMAAVVAETMAARDGINVTFSSAGVSAEEAGNPMDSRAVAVLKQAGYPVGPHVAHKATAQEVVDADLVIGMEQLHLTKLRQLAPAVDDLYLLTDFDRDAVPGSEVADPWYGEDADFKTTLSQIEAAMPEVLKRASELG